MMLTEQISTSCTTERQTRPLIWGLSARELYEAYWRSYGVHCVRRGITTSVPRYADLYLLTEADQLVLFDLQELTARMVWRKATVTRLRIIDDVDDSYTERVVMDRDGMVERIERLYRPRTSKINRVVVTTSRRVARIWAAAPARRDGWVGVRHAVPWSRVDHGRCAGICNQAGDGEDERQFITELVARWSNPGQSIKNIEERDRGVWALQHDPEIHDGIVVGPVWLGSGTTRVLDGCIVGPTWIEDNGVLEKPAVLRDVNDIDIAEVRSGAVPATPPASTYAIAKRTFDIVVSLMVLAAGLPLYLIVALLIFLEDGRPVFFAQVRQTRGGRLFRCWKFRTMYRNSEAMAPDLDSQNACDGPQVFIKSDPRVTRVGRILRIMQIDEMPQFWNVLVGQMSIVGPRPSPDRENQYCPAWRETRLSVRPGITGLWQVRRTRAEGEDFQEWIKYDMEYVGRAGFWYDIRLCIETVWVLVFRLRS